MSIGNFVMREAKNTFFRAKTFLKKGLLMETSISFANFQVGEEIRLH